MDAAEVVRLVRALADAEVLMWLMGGWAIDALIRRQRRPHDDLDLLVRDVDLAHATGVLATAGYAGEIGMEGSSYLVDPAGRQVDIHAVRFHSDGRAEYRMEDGRPWLYEPGAFDGIGTVLDRDVPCLTPEMMMIEHATGYALDAVHRADVAALAEAFGLPVPQQGQPSG
jgi:lincosamide nucleotidyltransferase A/C/D/E